jgi:hypothetical protein
MEPEGSLPRSQESSTGSYPEPDRSNPHHPILFSEHIENDLKQGDGLSSLLFNFALEYGIRPVRENQVEL